MLCAAGLLVGVFGVSRQASAETIDFNFDLISQSPTSLNTQAESQFRVSVSDIVGNPSQVVFRFTNVGSIASSITDIYFDDGTPASLMSIFSVPATPGVDFAVGAKPGDLPGGDQAGVDFDVTDKLLAADSNSPTMSNGINPGEYLNVFVTLLNNATFETLKVSLAGSNPMRVGIHVQGFADGSSASYVTVKPGGGTTQPPPDGTAVPLPATVWAGLALMGGLGVKRLSRRKAAAV